MNRSFYRLAIANLIPRRWLKRRLTPGGWTVLLGILTAAALGLDTNQSLAYQIFTFLVALLGIAIAAARFIHCRLSASRTLPRFGTVGIPLNYRVTVENRTAKTLQGLKLWETPVEPLPHFRTVLHLPLRQALARFTNVQRAKVKPVALPDLPPQGTTEVKVELLPCRRGLLRLQGLTVTIPDPLGLWNRCIPLSLPASVLILPKRYRIPPINLTGNRSYQSGGVALASSVGDSEEFRALRDYRPGDSPRKIHWKSWAKVGKPIVKEEQDEFFVRHALILDTFWPEPESERFEEAVAIAASYACEVQTQESLLDLMFIGLESYCFTVGRGLGQTERMLELLAAVTPCSDCTFDQLLPVVLERIALLSGCICVLLDWDEPRRSFIQTLAQYPIPLLVLVITETPPEPLSADERYGSQTQLKFLTLGQIQAGLMGG